MNWAKTTARRGENILSFGTHFGVAYIRDLRYLFLSVLSELDRRNAAVDEFILQWLNMSAMVPQITTNRSFVQQLFPNNRTINAGNFYMP